jgi:hypothetical protein
MSLQVLHHRIFNDAYFPDHWKDENISPPNDLSKKNAFKVCEIFYGVFKIIFSVVSCTKEGGVYLRYSVGDRVVIIETYNDGDIGCMIVDYVKKEVLYNKDIERFNFQSIFEFINKL